MSLDALVETLVFRGVLSPGDDLKALREVLEVRRALDLATADDVTEALRGGSHPRLHALVDDMVRLAREGSTFQEQDRAFHTEMLAEIDNSLVGQLVTAFWDVHFAVLPKLGMTLPDDLTDTAEAHRAMLLAAEAGDAEGYRRAVVEHYAPLERSLDARQSVTD
jgi:DNA-binding FadR family transcriptional regulator